MAEYIEKTDTLNEGREKLNEGIKASERAESKSDQAVSTAQLAVNTADTAESKADSVQQQFNNVVIEGDSSVEAAQARVKEDGSTFDTLRDRLNSSDSQLAQTSEVVNVIQTKRVSVESFPRLVGELDDTNRIMRAYGTLNTGDTFIIPKDYTITNVVFDKDDIFFEWTGWLTQSASASGVAVTLGKVAPTFSVEGLLKVKKETRDWTQESIGVKILNMNEGIFTVDIRNFTNNLVLEGDGNGCAYNEITIKKLHNGKKNLSFNRLNSGWINENKLYSGRFMWASGIADKDRYHIYIPDGSNNNNVFFSPSLESADGGTFIYCNGQYNHFYSPRLEGSSETIKVKFGVNSIYNQVVYPYAHSDVLNDTNYIDNGTRNHILSRDDLLFNHSRVRASAFVGIGNPKQNASWGSEAVFEGQSTSSSSDKIFKGKNAGGAETFSVNGSGDVSGRVYYLQGTNRVINNLGTLYGDHWNLVDDGYNTRSVKIAAIKSTAGAPFGSLAMQGAAVLNTEESKIYFHMGNGVWKGIALI